MEGERESTFYGGRTWIHLLWRMDDFFPLRQGKITLISGRMTYSSFYVTAFPNRSMLGVPSYSVGGGVIDSWENIYLYHGDPVGNFTW